jgi:hypothetical protein
VVEHYLDTVGVTGSNPVSRTTVSDLYTARCEIHNVSGEAHCHTFTVTPFGNGRTSSKSRRIPEHSPPRNGSSRDCHDSWAAVPAAAERRPEFGYDSYGDLTGDDDRGYHPKLKTPASNNITIFSVVRLLGTVMTIIVT